MNPPTPEQLAALNVRIAEMLPPRGHESTLQVDGAWRCVMCGAFTSDGAGPCKHAVPVDFTGSLDAITPAIRQLCVKADARWNFTAHLQNVTAEPLFGLATAEPISLAIALDRTLSEKPIL